MNPFVGLSGFGTIVADPPWKYGAWGKASIPRSKNHVPAIQPMPYQTMTVQEIAALPVAECASDDCDLYLWTTQKYLPDAFCVMRAWGFRYCQALTWCKAPMGTGQGGLFCPTTEFLLLGRKGRMPQGKRRVDSTWWHVKRTNVHSRKPEFFQDMVETVSDGPRLELFARRARPGWVTLGNEADGLDMKDSLILLAQRQGKRRMTASEAPLAGVRVDRRVMPHGQYRCILADPPWALAMAGQRKRAKEGAKPEALPYPTMTIDEICAMPVAGFAAEDCHLWLWTTNQHLEDGFKVMRAWGFKYLAPVHWVKPTGMGNWFVHRSQTMLFGYRQKCRFPLARYRPNVFQTGDPKRHSEKPDASYELIEAVSPGPRLELFARRKRGDWHTWGNEVPCDVSMGHNAEAQRPAVAGTLPPLVGDSD